MLSELRRKVFSGKAVRSKNSHFYFIEKKKKKKRKKKKRSKAKMQIEVMDPVLVSLNDQR